MMPTKISTDNKNLKSILLISIFLILTLPTTFTLQFKAVLQPQQKFCFYQILEAQQKYTFAAFSADKAKHAIDVAHIDGGQWKFIFERVSNDYETSTRVDKLASTSTTYSFCLKNMAYENQVFKIQFNTGLAVMQLHNLPDLTDGEHLQQQIKWLDQQTNILSDRADNIEKLRRINYQINGMVGTKMFFFAIIGLAVIAVANVTFYKILKKAFKDRKLI